MHNNIEEDFYLFLKVAYTVPELFLEAVLMNVAKLANQDKRSMHCSILIIMTKYFLW